MFRFLILSAMISAALSVNAARGPEFNAVFGSHMVLQQETPVVFFGRAEPNAEVKLTFYNQTKTVKSNEKGGWEVRFPAMKAGGPYRVKAESNGKTVELNDVMTGEVWLCSGQSNMELPVGNKYIRGATAANSEEEVRNANHPEIRICKQHRFYDRKAPHDTPVFDLKWSVCSPKTIPNFSAVAYFFGRELQRKRNVPVGLILSAWSGSRIEPWISEQGYRRAGLQKELGQIEKFKKTDAELAEYKKESKRQYLKKLALWEPELEAAAAFAKTKTADYPSPDFDDSKWNLKQEPIRADQYHIRWYRASFTLSKEQLQQSVSLRIWSQGLDFCEYYVNGKKAGGWQINRPFHGKIEPEFLREGKNTLALRITRIYKGWERNIIDRSRVKLFAGRTEIVISPWKNRDEVAIARSKIKSLPPERWIVPFENFTFPANLYNYMIAPWTRLPVRGIVWYQGCSNAGETRYYPLEKALIADWREQWKKSDMPFLIVQLAGYGWVVGKGDRPAPEKDPKFPLTREIQAEMRQIPHTGLVCAIDLGETTIHPGNKQEVGRRLAMEAMRTAYGFQGVTHGPVFDYARTEGNTIRVFFRKEGLGSGLVSKNGEPLGSFALAGSDGKLVWANAKIEGNTVVVSSPKVPVPTIVRYAYAPLRADANLCNKEGYPAYPFRSDKPDYTNQK